MEEEKTPATVSRCKAPILPYGETAERKQPRQYRDRREIATQQALTIQADGTFKTAYAHHHDHRTCAKPKRYGEQMCSRPGMPANVGNAHGASTSSNLTPRLSCGART